MERIDFDRLIVGPDFFLFSFFLFSCNKNIFDGWPGEAACVEWPHGYMSGSFLSSFLLFNGPAIPHDLY